MLCKKGGPITGMYFCKLQVWTKDKRSAMKAIWFHRSKGIKCTQNVAANMSPFFLSFSLQRL